MITISLLLPAFFLAWIVQRMFKLKLDTPEFIFLTLLMWFFLGMAWLLCPAALKIYGPD